MATKIFGGAVTLAKLRSVLDGIYVSPTKAGRESLIVTAAASQLTWRAALANRQNAPAITCHIGDSITEGQGPNSISARWVARFRDLIRERYSTPGIAGGFGYYPSFFAATIPAQWAYGAPTGGQLLTGFGKRTTALPATGTATITVTGTSAKLLYTKTAGGGSFTYTVDGGAPSGPISTNNATLVAGNGQTISLGAAGPHTLVLLGATGTSYIEGLMVYNGDEAAGIQVIEAGHSAYTSTDFATNTGYWTGPMGNLQPHLVTIELGANDWTAGVAPATTKANLLTMIAAIRAAYAGNPSIVLMPVYQRNFTSSTPWAQYVTAQKEIAAADDQISLLDLSGRLPNVLGDTRNLYVDAVHPSAKGHALIAENVADFLGIN